MKEIKYKIVSREESFGFYYPNLLHEWDYELNIVDPFEVSRTSSYEAHWKINYYDKELNKNFILKWQASIARRVAYKGCPYITGHRVLEGFNDLATRRPDLVNEWHPTKNGDLLPSQIYVTSNKKVWWQCNKDPRHEWFVSPSNRINKNTGCPVCADQKKIQGVNDFATLKPEVAKEWHPTKNGDLLPTQISIGSQKRAWWLCSKCGHEWKAVVATRSNGSGCPHCSMSGTSIPELAILYYIKQLQSNVLHRHKLDGYEFDVYLPEQSIAIEYDGSVFHKDKLEKENKKDEYCREHDIRLIRLRGKELLPTESAEIIWVNESNYNTISPSIKELLDLLYKDNKIEVSVDLALPELIKFKDLKEQENSLSSLYPEIAAEWSPTKNGVLKPENFSYGSKKKVWWQCDKGHEWQAVICDRVGKKSQCPYCSNRKVLTGFNDLETVSPEFAKEWNCEKNGDLLPSQVLSGSGSSYWWKCPKCGYEWQATPNRRNYSPKCPSCKHNPLKDEIEI